MQIGVDSGESVLASWPAGAPLTPEAAFDLILEHLHKEGLSANQTAQLRYAHVVAHGKVTGRRLGRACPYARV